MEDLKSEVPAPLDSKGALKKSSKENGPIQVKAIEEGWYGNNRIKIGDKFTISSEKVFSDRWMEKLASKK